MNQRQQLTVSTISILLIAVVVSMFVAFPQMAHAQDAQGLCDVQVAGRDESGLCNSPGDPVNSTLNTVIDIMLTIVGVIAVITIIIGGIQYLTSAGDASRANRGRSTIIYSIVAVIVAVLARSIIIYVLDRV